MGLVDKARATMGSFRTLPSLNRRLFHLEQAAESTRTAMVEHSRQISETAQRAAALEHQVEHLHAVLTSVDPQMTLDIVTGVRDSVRDLTIRLAEQANESSASLARAGGARGRERPLRLTSPRRCGTRGCCWPPGPR